MSNIKVIRINSISNGGGKKQAKIDFYSALSRNNLSNNIRLKDGDRIIIDKTENNMFEQMKEAIRSNLNPKFINVYISGKVMNPGRYEISKLAYTWRFN